MFASIADTKCNPGQPGVDMGSTLGQYVFNSGSVCGQTGVNMRSTRGQFAVNLHRPTLATSGCVLPSAASKV
jgi:hypothetical protein